MTPAQAAAACNTNTHALYRRLALHTDLRRLDADGHFDWRAIVPLVMARKWRVGKRAKRQTETRSD